MAKQATARVREFADKHCTVAVPGREEFRRAAELAGDDVLKLRAGDALHLAIAGSLNAQGILCLDEAMIEDLRARASKPRTQRSCQALLREIQSVRRRPE